MKKFLLCISLTIGLYTKVVEAADIKSVAVFLDNVKHLVTRVMSASQAVQEVKTSLSEKDQDILNRAAKEAAEPKKISWSDTLKNVLEYAKPTTDTVIGGVRFDGTEAKFQPGIIIALLNMVTSFPKALPAHESFSGVRNSFARVAPVAAKLNTQARTLAVRLAYVYTIITSLQQLAASFSPKPID